MLHYEPNLNFVPTVERGPENEGPYTDLMNTNIVQVGKCSIVKSNSSFSTGTTMTGDVRRLRDLLSVQPLQVLS